jgi:hypothetical protein
VLRSSCVMTLSWAGTELVVVCISRVSLSLFEGCGMEEGPKWVVQSHGVTPAILHSTRTAPGVAGQWQVGRTAPGSDSQAVSGDRRGSDSPLTRVLAVHQGIKDSGRGSR